MKKIEALTAAAGSDFSVIRGRQYELEDHIADDLIKAGHAVAVVVKAKPGPKKKITEASPEMDEPESIDF